ncbi:MAG: aminotransferase class III-fold pyridoxal phosphate-dependent enzyme [Verrucomicrobia bacterium]|nr:aminotransferase class III-fold pyridoxal phosphate-dependent enzyme [Verrucomicrobiota bacterium]
MIRARTPEALKDLDRPLDECIAACFPRSRALLEAARHSLFYSLPVAFDPAQGTGCYLATVDRDERDEPWRFLDMGAQIATCAFGENDPDLAEVILAGLPTLVNRYAHSEYQTVTSLRFKAALDRLAPKGTPRHFVVNTGAEAVENAIKAALLVRARTAGVKEGGVIVSFEGAFHGRTLGALAVTHRKKARLGFPTFDWPQAVFPTEDSRQPGATLRREERSLRQVWQILRGHGQRESFADELARIDTFLAQPGNLAQFVATERERIGGETLKRAQRVAAVIIEPIQGEGGVRLASARFFKRLRLLTLIHDVPLIFDEVQTGFGATGRMWAHEHFDLPAPPDAVTWAKKAQNGVLFVSEALAAFFQEEKKFNTTWEGDPVGMLRLMATMDRLDLDQVRRTGAAARAALEGLQARFPELIQKVRGLGVMLAFDVARSDWRDVLRDRAFRRGLILLPAGERALRFYPRYDTSDAAIQEAVEILAAAVEDILTRGAAVPLGPELRASPMSVPPAGAEVIELDAQNFPEHRASVMTVEIERYGSLSHYPPDVLHEGRRPLLQFPVEAIESTLANPRAVGLALRFSGRIIAYAVGSPLENYDEEGVHDDPHFGEHQTYYLLAMAVHPSVENAAEIERHLLDLLRTRVIAQSYQRLAALVEERFHTSGPPWLRSAEVLRVVDNYLRSGVRFVYLHTTLADRPAPAATTS